MRRGASGPRKARRGDRAADRWLVFPLARGLRRLRRCRIARPARNLSVRGPGIAGAVASLVVISLLTRAKCRLAEGIRSGALRADAKQTDLCTYLSAIHLGGLVLNATLGRWWADGRRRVVANRWRCAFRRPLSGGASGGCRSARGQSDAGVDARVALIFNLELDLVRRGKDDGS